MGANGYECAFRPDLIATDVYLAAGATVRGTVHIAERCTVMFGAVIRGDSVEVRIGPGSNVQDLCCLHGDPGFPCILGAGVTLGHRAIVHGAIVEDDCLIGIGAIVLNGARIGRGSIIAAGALVPEGKSIPPGSLVMGIPGKVVRQTNAEDLAAIRHAAEHYVELGRAYRRLTFP